MHCATGDDENKHSLVQKKSIYTYSYFELSICIYSVMGENDQMSTNTCRYSTCCAANVYIFVYIFIGAPILLLSSSKFATESLRLQYFITAYHSTTELSEQSHNCHHDTVTIIRMKIVADQKEHEVQYQQVPPQIIDRSALVLVDVSNQCCPCTLNHIGT